VEWLTRVRHLLLYESAHTAAWPLSKLKGMLTHCIPSDLHTNNILFQIPNFDSWTENQLYKNFGEPVREPNRRLDGCPLGPEVPTYSLYPVDMVVAADKIEDDNIRIKISDFGEAYFTNRLAPKTLHTPMLLQPPEAFFKEDVGASADVWTLACTLFEILGDCSLFEAFIPNVDDTFAEMVSTLGPLPKRWWSQWQKRPAYFLEDGSWNPEFSGILDPVTRPLEQRLASMGRGDGGQRTDDRFEFSAAEMASLEELLRSMLKYEPSERISAAEVMESDYMRRWGRRVMKKAPELQSSAAPLGASLLPSVTTTATTTPNSIS
jgi:serine/threonine-protein kinase SRPK3